MQQHLLAILPSAVIIDADCDKRFFDGLVKKYAR
jgi:hypothetical protein